VIPSPECCVVLLESKVLLCSGQAGNRTPKIWAAEESQFDSSPRRGRNRYILC
jgi:hypothetical protein